MLTLIDLKVRAFDVNRRIDHANRYGWLVASMSGDGQTTRFGGLLKFLGIRLNRSQPARTVDARGSEGAVSVAAKFTEGLA